MAWVMAELIKPSFPSSEFIQVPMPRDPAPRRHDTPEYPGGDPLTPKTLLFRDPNII